MFLGESFAVDDDASACVSDHANCNDAVQGGTHLRIFLVVDPATVVAGLRRGRRSVHRPTLDLSLPPAPNPPLFASSFMVAFFPPPCLPSLFQTRERSVSSALRVRVLDQLSVNDQGTKGSSTFVR